MWEGNPPHMSQPPHSTEMTNPDTWGTHSLGHTHSCLLASHRAFRRRRCTPWLLTQASLVKKDWAGCDVGLLLGAVASEGERSGGKGRVTGQDHVSPLPVPWDFHFCHFPGFLYGHLICFTREVADKTVQPQEITPLSSVPVNHLQPGGRELILQINSDITYVAITHGEKIKHNKERRTIKKGQSLVPEMTIFFPLLLLTLCLMWFSKLSKTRSHWGGGKGSHLF